MWADFNILARRRLAWEAATLLRTCAVGGTLLLRAPELLTTFAPGILYVLSLCFERMLLVRPFTACAASSEVCVLLSGRLPEAPEADAAPERGAVGGEGEAAVPGPRKAWQHLLWRVRRPMLL